MSSNTQLGRVWWAFGLRHVAKAPRSEMRVQEGWLARKAVREELLAAASQFGLESGVRHGAERDTAYRAQGMEPLVDVTQSSLGGTWTWHGLMVMLGHGPEEEKARSVREALRAAGHEAPQGSVRRGRRK